MAVAVLLSKVCPTSIFEPGEDVYPQTRGAGDINPPRRARVTKELSMISVQGGAWSVQSVRYPLYADFSWPRRHKGTKKFIAIKIKLRVLVPSWQKCVPGHRRTRPPTIASHGRPGVGSAGCQLSAKLQVAGCAVGSTISSDCPPPSVVGYHASL